MYCTSEKLHVQTVNDYKYVHEWIHDCCTVATESLSPHSRYIRYVIESWCFARRHTNTKLLQIILVSEKRRKSDSAPHLHTSQSDIQLIPEREAYFFGWSFHREIESVKASNRLGPVLWLKAERGSASCSRILKKRRCMSSWRGDSWRQSCQLDESLKSHNINSGYD